MLLLKDTLYRICWHARKLMHAVDEQAILAISCRVILNEPNIGVQFLSFALPQVSSV